MKKVIITIACALFAIGASAQDSGHFGLIGGVTTTNTQVSVKGAVESLQSKNFNQFHIGFCYYQPLILGLAIQPGIEYNVKGASVTGLEYRAGFLEIPVQIQWGFNILSIVRPYIMAEPFIGYAVNTDYSVSLTPGYSVGTNRTRFEGGIGLGAGLDLFKHLQVSFRYYWNLGDISAINLHNMGIRMNNSQGFKVSAAIFL